MKSRTQLLTVILLLTLLSSCSTDINVLDYLDKEKPLVLTINQTDSSTGLTTSNQKFIQPTDTKFQEFFDWCDRNKSDWKSSPASFVGQFSVTQGDFGLLYINDGVVIHFLDKEGKPGQFTKSVDRRELQFLVED